MREKRSVSWRELEKRDMLVGVLACIATPTHISGFAVEPTVTRIYGTPYTTLAISSDPDVDGLLSVTHPDHPQQRVHEELEDAHGVLGVWPSARAACTAQRSEKSPSALRAASGGSLASGGTWE